MLIITSGVGTVTYPEGAGRLTPGTLSDTVP